MVNGGWNASQLDVFIEEEQANDAEVNHTTEDVGYYAMLSGLIFADSSENGTDTITGGDGLDVLYGGDGADTFIFESASAFNDVDVIVDFRDYQGDVLDISDLIVGVFSGNITDYLQFTEVGTDTLIQVDANGLTGGSNYLTIGQFEAMVNLDETTLHANGNIVV